MPLLFNLFPPRLPWFVWGPLFFPVLWAILSWSYRQQMLARRLGRGAFWPTFPLGGPMLEASRTLGSREAWEEAFTWLGRDPLSGANLRWFAVWFMCVAFAAAILTQ